MKIYEIKQNLRLSVSKYHNFGSFLQTPTLKAELFIDLRRYSRLLTKAIVSVKHIFHLPAIEGELVLFLNQVFYQSRMFL